VKVVIIGAGGHGREVAEILKHREQHDNSLSVIGFIDDNPALAGSLLNDLPVLGDWNWFDGIDRADIGLVCAVGSPRITRDLTRRATELGLKFVNAISPLAHVSPSAVLGCGVVMFPNTVVSTNCFLSDYCVLNVGATVSHDTKIGRYSNINPGAHLAGNVAVGEGSYIGMGASVIQGISIGDWTVIGAGAVVIRDLPDNIVAVGVPAKIIKTC
jgi:UDP-perosamine 4-acetyltransferase